MGAPEETSMNLDRICRENTAFRDFGELINSHPGYRPSLDMREGWARDLADAYDKVMAERGDARRAYRYNREAYAAAAAAKAAAEEEARMTPLQRAKHEVAKAYAEAQREIRQDPDLRRLRWRKGRGRPMYALDCDGNRINDGGWDEFRGVWKDVQKLIDANPRAVEIFVDGGIDCAENREAMENYDYETVRYQAVIWRRD